MTDQDYSQKQAAIDVDFTGSQVRGELAERRRKYVGEKSEGR